MMLRAICFLTALAALSCEPKDGPPDNPFTYDLLTIGHRYRVSSIAAVVVKDGEVLKSDAWGIAGPERDATSDTIYGLASCSKPIVGLALAMLLEEHPDVDLDGDINDLLDWSPRIAHPRYAEEPITLRQLVAHRGGLASDAFADYETYPKPDPDRPLDDFLRETLARPEAWAPRGPGSRVRYSNLGAALVAAVIEAVSGEDFRDFTQSRIFDPLGMDDTRWFYGDLTAEQQARHAIPYDQDYEPYEIYGFNDYPSGLLRSTADDLGKLLIALMDEGGDALSTDAVRTFLDTPMLIEAGEEGAFRMYDHAGSETGVSTYLTFGEDGVGFAWLINSDVEIRQENDLIDDLTARMRAEADGRGDTYYLDAQAER